MKKFLPTLLLLAVALGGFWYAKSENYFREEPKPAGTKLVELAKEDITALRLTGGAEPLELKKNGDKWDMVKPAAYPVEGYAGDSLASSFEGLQFKAVIDEKGEDLAGYGLDKPALEVEAVLKDGSSRKLLIGNALPISGSTYVKLADSPAVYEMEDYLLTGLRKEALDFLDKSVFDLGYDKVKSVELEWKGQKWTLTKTDPAKKAYESAWKLGDKELKPEEGTAILDKLTFLSTDRLPKPRGEVDLATAEFKLTVTEDDAGKETKKSYTGKIDNQLVRIAAEGGAWAFAAGADSIQEIYDKGKP